MRRVAVWSSWSGLGSERSIQLYGVFELVGGN